MSLHDRAAGERGVAPVLNWMRSLIAPPERIASVLFVCTGNICRSPTAEGVFRALVKQEGLADRIVIDSAGTVERKLRPNLLYGLEEMKCRAINAVSVLTPLLKSSSARGAAFPNSGRKSRLSRSRLKVPPEPCPRITESVGRIGTGQVYPSKLRSSMNCFPMITIICRAGAFGRNHRCAKRSLLCALLSKCGTLRWLFQSL